MKLETDEKIVKYIRTRIREAGNIVAVLGIEMLVEGGGYDLDSNEETYRVEEEYGFSPEDMLSSSFLNAKGEKFYRFYRNEILGMKVGSTPAYDALLRLQDCGKLSAVVSQNFHGIPDGVHFNNVIEINGNMKANMCPRCNRTFDIDYVRNSPNIVPQCDQCKVVIRPDIRLIGERMDAKIMTKAETVCDAAEILLILGKNMYNDVFGYNISSEKKQLRVLFSKDKHKYSKMVDFVISDEIKAFLPIIVE